MPTLSASTGRQTLLVAAAVAAVVIGVSIGHRNMSERHEARLLHERTTLTAEQVALRLQAHLGMRLALAGTLQEAFDNGTITTRADFERHAAALHARHRGGRAALRHHRTLLHPERPEEAGGRDEECWQHFSAR